VTTATLWLEITIAGFLFLIAGCILLLACLAVPIPEVLAALNTYKDLLPYAGVGFLGLSFITGT